MVARVPLTDSERLERAWARLAVAFRAISATTKVLLVTVGSIVTVIVASLIISIVQFQLRLSEARIQNGNITLESIQLIADHQSYISARFKAMRDQSEKLNTLRANYLSQLNSTSEVITSLCNLLTADKADACFNQLSMLINLKNGQLDGAIAEFRPAKLEPQQEFLVKHTIDSLKQIMTSGMLYQAHQQYFATQQLVQSECQTLSQFISERVPNVSLLGVSPELRMTIIVQCFSGNVGSTTTAAPVQAQGQAQTVADTRAADPLRLGEAAANDQNRGEIGGVNRLLLSELVFYYKFYSWLTSYFGEGVHEMILSPPEFSIILLVIITGILGSFLYHTFTMFQVKDSALYPSFLAILLRATLGVMCALVIYILSRTGFVALTEGSQRPATISPFVIAFISVASGLLAERALDRISDAGLGAILGRNTATPNANGSGGGDDAAATPPAASTALVVTDTSERPA